MLAKLPATPYELAEWKSATVQFNYHISVNGMLYSVPYEFIKRKVDVRLTEKVVEIFYNHNRIASHGRLYGRLPDLLLELDMARSEGNYKKVLAKYARPVLLILDEWLLLKPNETEQHDILELLHQRRKRSSTIFCSQYDPAGWYDQLGGDESPLAEAILDRIKHDAYKINIVSADATQYRSMREVYGMDPAKSE